MKLRWGRGRWMVILAAAIGLAVFFAFLWERLSPQPTLQGKSLSYWLSRLKEQRYEEVAVAFELHGAESVPFLARALRLHEPVSQKFFRYVGFKSKYFLPMNLRRKLVMGDNSIFNIRYLAVATLSDLGARASNAVPALEQTLGDSDPFFRETAAVTLGNIGVGARGAVPALIHALGDSNRTVQSAAVKALGQIGPAAKAALPMLATRLRREKSVELKSVMRQSIDRIRGRAGGVTNSLERSLIGTPRIPVERSNALSRTAG